MKPVASTHEASVLKLASKQALVRARDLAERGIPTLVLSRMVSKGSLARVGRGVYALPNRSAGEHASLAEVAIQVPRGVICLLSALRVHDIGTQSPFEVWVAIEHRMTPPKLANHQLRIVRMSGRAFSEGVIRERIDGIDVPVFNAAKTIADCFKYRNKIGMDVALEALREGWRERRVKMDDLWRYAEIDRVANVMRPYLETLTA
ncbi:MAG TPA: type IV toxin-antitoxin system AbiEi family antitoxin domain-containing protein [Steroidobacteraceae bacterium]|nr:type IV toxin-antitoxin system AbiEi family antitoxin domain-containing protein [Steroidobacteraceae bacterium]